MKTQTLTRIGGLLCIYALQFSNPPKEIRHCKCLIVLAIKEYPEQLAE